MTENVACLGTVLWAAEKSVSFYKQVQTVVLDLAQEGGETLMGSQSGSFLGNWLNDVVIFLGLSGLIHPF